MTTSEYEVMTAAELALDMGGITFATVDALYIQTVVESWISQAERMVYTVTGVKPTSTDVFSRTWVPLLAKRIAVDNFALRGHIVEGLKVASLVDLADQMMKMWQIAKNTDQAKDDIAIYQYTKQR